VCCCRSKGAAPPTDTWPLGAVLIHPGISPDEQRQVILLVGLEGMRYEEVATVLGIPIGTVRSRLSRGRDMLRELMDMKEEAADIARKRAASALRAAA